MNNEENNKELANQNIPTEQPKPTVQPVEQPAQEPQPTIEPVEQPAQEKSKKGKYIATTIFFLLLFTGVFFLPEITVFVDELMGTSPQYIEVKEEEKLLYYNCDLEIDNNDVLYKYNYHIYQNDDTSMISSIVVTTTTNTEKEEVIDTTNRLCIVYQDTVKDIYEVECDLDEQEHTMVEYFTYMDEMTSIDKEISEMNATILEYTSETRSLQVVGELRDSGYQCREIFE